MVRASCAILVDTNLILEAHRIKCWKALVGGYQLVTVEACLTETLTGSFKKELSDWIDQKELRKAIAVHDVSEDDILDAEVAGALILDKGEKHLWAYAMTQSSKWLYCGPDTASLEFGCSIGHQFDIVSLQRLLEDIGRRPGDTYRKHYGEQWQRKMFSNYHAKNSATGTS